MEKKINSGQLRLLAILLGCIIAVVVATDALGQESSRSSFIYGTVKTVDNSYQGYMRWGGEEAFWFEYFNAAKEDNDYYRKIVEKKGDTRTSWYDIEDWSIASIWDNKRSGVNKEFSCQFGEISKIDVRDPERAIVHLKNGIEIEVNGSGYNDIGSSVELIDEEIGKLKIKWSRIREIVFEDGTNSDGITFGDVLYAKVQTARKGTMTGYLQWDQDERVSEDMLDGDSRHGDVSIAFSKIAQIRKEGNGSVVTLKSGRDLFLTDSNDVNSENRGIILFIDGTGEVEIPWRSFVSADFITPDQKLVAFGDYTAPKGIQGIVYLHDNSSVTGKIIYDVDEVWELETLEAKDDNITYRIPFRNIKEIKPKNFDYSLVTLKSGESLLLGGRSDVSDANDGVLIFSQGDQEPRHIPWEKISEIIFN